MPNSLKNLIGGVAGGAIGYFLFDWFLKYGFYAMIAPGGLIGVGASFWKHRFFALPFITGIGSYVLGMYTEWQHWPMRADPSFVYFITHPHHLTPPSLLMIFAGAALGFYLPYAQYRRAVLPI